MNSKYEAPVVIENETLAEGVFTASGDSCYTVTAKRTQVPETGRNSYVFQLYAQHKADHHSTGQQLVITFSGAVEYLSCNGQGATYVSGNGTNTLTINFSYHANYTESHGLGDLYVKSSASNLQFISATLYDTNMHATHDGCY